MDEYHINLYFHDLVVDLEKILHSETILLAHAEKWDEYFHRNLYKKSNTRNILNLILLLIIYHRYFVMELWLLFEEIDYRR